jgi:hypothetical protein
MQYLLDFVQDHMVADQLCIRLGSAAGELELLHVRGAPAQACWQVRATASYEPARKLPRAQLLEYLKSLSVDMIALQSELHALLATQVTFAEVVLRDAAELLGLQPPAAAREARRELLGILWLSLQELGPEPERPSLRAVNAETAETPARAGHLTLVP